VQVAVFGTTRSLHFSLAINSITVQLWIQVFWVISVYFNIRNTLPKSGTFLLGHSVYIACLVKISIFAVRSPPPCKAGRYDFSPRSPDKTKFSNRSSPQDFSDDDDDDDDEQQSK